MALTALDFVVGALDIPHQWRSAVAKLAQEAANYSFLYDLKVKEVETLKADAKTRFDVTNEHITKLEAQIAELKADNATLRCQLELKQDDLNWACTVRDGNENTIKFMMEVVVKHPSVFAEIACRNKIGTIKALRLVSNMGLKEAKEAVDAVLAANPS